MWLIKKFQKMPKLINWNRENCTTISGTRSYHCFIPLSKSKLVMKRLSLDDEGVLVKLYDDTTKSVLPHLQLIENDLHVYP